jgi:hypothetical protein
MAVQLKAWEVPLRLGTGVFILDSGLGKLSKDAVTAAQTHGFAASAYGATFVVDQLTERRRGTRRGSRR